MAMLTLKTLRPNAREVRHRLGRGNASGTGTTAGRGTKGQKARTGGAGGLKLRGLKATFKSIPKSKGFTSQYSKMHFINLAELDKRYEANSIVHLDRYKVLGQGSLTKPLTVYAASFSESAKTQIEAQHGKVITCGKHS